MTEKHQLLTDLQLEEKFRKKLISPRWLTHEAHLRLAYIHIKKYGLRRAIKNLTEQIARFDFEIGDSTKFNKTVTVASIRVVYEFIKKSNSADFRTLLLKYPRLKSNFKGLLRAHYKIDIFNSVRAKQEYVKPDLLPF